MVFFVLACQCMSTVAVARRETNGWTWPIVMIVMMNTPGLRLASLAGVPGRPRARTGVAHGLQLAGPRSWQAAVLLAAGVAHP